MVRDIEAFKLEEDFHATSRARTWSSRGVLSTRPSCDFPITSRFNYQACEKLIASKFSQFLQSTMRGSGLTSVGIDIISEFLQIISKLYECQRLSVTKDPAVVSTILSCFNLSKIHRGRTCGGKLHRIQEQATALLQRIHASSIRQVQRLIRQMSLFHAAEDDGSLTSCMGRFAVQESEGGAILYASLSSSVYLWKGIFHYIEATVRQQGTSIEEGALNIILLMINVFDNKIKTLVRGQDNMTQAGRQQLIQQELGKLQFIQNNVADSSHACDFVVNCLSYCLNREFNEDGRAAPASAFVSLSPFAKIISAIFKFGNCLMSWGNRRLQNIMIAAIKEPRPTTSVSNCNWLHSINRFIEKSLLCRLNCISNSMDLGLEVIFDSEIFRVIIYMCEFLSCLCFPHYLAAKEVLGKTHFHGDRSYVTERDSSNSISTQLLKLTRAVMKLLIKSIHYIDYQPFTSNVAPWVDERLAKRRRLFSWHNPDNNFPLLSALVQVFPEIFFHIWQTCLVFHSWIRDFRVQITALGESTTQYHFIDISSKS